MSSEANEDLHDRHERLLELAQSGKDEVFAGEDSGRSELPEGLEPKLREFGAYRILRLLGHGGQGVVYLATDPRLGRDVALKLISVGGSATEEGRTRFEREASSASRLQHPGICTVFEAGEIEGQRFLAMEFIDGESLPDWIRRITPGSDDAVSGVQQSRVDRALEIVEQLARAVHAAHEAGIVHRDLKPDNVMLRRDGSPVVLDFGLARDESAGGESLTMLGDVLGTPAYMPPERIQGTSVGADPREDVYGLGAILFECLTGKRPFEGHTREHLYRRILTEPVEDPRRSDVAIPREARFVVEAALNKVVNRRYASALELAEDVGRLRRREPIRARPLPRWLRVHRWVQRNPQAAALFVVLLLGMTISSWLFVDRGEALRDARARALVGDSALSMASDVQRALREARQAFDLRESAATRSQLYEVLAQTRQISGWEDGNVTITTLFAAENRRVTVKSGGLRIRNETGAIVRKVRFSSPAESADLDATGRRVVVSSRDCVARVYSTFDGELLFELRTESPGRARPGILYNRRLVQFSPTDPDLILVGAQNGASLWRLADAPQCVWKRPESRVHYLTFSPDGAYFAVGNEDGAVGVFHTESRSLLGMRPGQGGPVRAIAFHPRRPLLVSGGDDGVVRVWSLDATPRGALAVTGTAILHLAFSPSIGDRPVWLSGCDNNRAVYLWRVGAESSEFDFVRRVDGHTGDVLMTTFSPDGNLLLTASRDGTARLLEVEGSEVARYRGGRAVRVCSFSADGMRAITTSAGGSTRIWRTADPVFRVVRHDKVVICVVVTDRYVIAGLRDGGAVAHDRRTWDRHDLRTGFDRMVWKAVVSRDEQRLVLADSAGRVRDWDLSGRNPRRLGMDLSVGHAIRGLAFDPAGSGDLAVSHAGGVFLTNTGGLHHELAKGVFQCIAWSSSGPLIAMGPGKFYWDLRRDDFGKYPPGFMTVVTASPDGRWVATAGGGGRVRLFDLSTKHLVHELEGHANNTEGLAFSPDSRLLASGSRDRTVRIWNVRTGALFATLRGHQGGVISCAFTPDGQELVTGSTDGTVRFWPMDFAKVQQLAEERSIR